MMVKAFILSVLLVLVAILALALWHAGVFNTREIHLVFRVPPGFVGFVKLCGSEPRQKISQYEIKLPPTSGSDLAVPSNVVDGIFSVEATYSDGRPLRVVYTLDGLREDEVVFFFDGTVDSNSCEFVFVGHKSQIVVLEKQSGLR